MQIEKINIPLTIGIAVQVLAVLFFVYVYYVSVPQKEDLKVFPVVTVPRIDDVALKKELNGLHVSQRIPLAVDPLTTGKQDPYQ